MICKLYFCHSVVSRREAYNILNMNIQILLFVLSIIAYFQSYQFYAKEKYTFSFALILLGGTFLRLLVMNDPFLHAWDERYHFLVAKNMLNNVFEPQLYAKTLLDYDYRSWASNHIWLHKPPFALWTIALSFKIFGVSAFAGRLPSLFFSSSCVYLTYQIALLLFKDQKTAIIAAFLHSINGLILEMGAGRISTDHIDTTFFFILECSVYLSLCFNRQNKYHFLVIIGILTGIAVLTKWYIGLFIIPMFFFATVAQERVWKTILQSILIFIISFPIFYTWQNYIMNHFPKEAIWEKSYNFRHLFENIEGHGQAWWYHLDKARIIWNELIYFIFAWFVVQWVRKPFEKPIYLLGFWVMIPYTIFSLCTTKMQGYLLFTAPAFFIMIAVFMVENMETFSLNKYLKYLPIIIILLSIRYSIERVKPFQNHAPSLAEKIQILGYKQRLSEPKTVIFNAQNYIEIMFYTDFVAYQRMPTLSEIEQIKKQGYAIALIRGNKMPDYILNDAYIKILP
jgi:4-amino-4-deoxy-L-arabinose transferase-like glycosyltransferase